MKLNQNQDHNSGKTSGNDNINININFNSNKNLKHRTVQSLKDRYRSFLKYLQKDDFNTIINHLNESGLKGYLQFESKTDGNKQLKSIQESEHREIQQ